MTTTTIGAFTTVTDALAALRARQISAVELLDLQLRRIDRFNPTLNAIVIPDFEHARERALVADNDRARGHDAPLLGLPLTIKDCIEVAGLPATAGVPEFANRIPAEDALLVQHVRGAGGVIMGKTNVPPMAGDWQANNPIFGRTNNPWDLARTPGGSTGGGAAALAAGLTPLEFGSDIGGSIRVPAAFCGVYGHRPSETALARSGHFPGAALPNPARVMAVQGPLARSAEDLTLAFDVVAGADIGEDAAWRLQLPQARHERLADFRIAVLPNPAWLPLDDGIAHAVQRVAEQLSHAGATVRTVQPPGLGDLRDYYRLYLSLLAVMIGGRFTSETRANAVARLRAGQNDFDDASAAGFEASAQQLLLWYQQREDFRAAYRGFFRDWDLLLAPITLVPAFPHVDPDQPWGERSIDINGRPERYSLQTFYPGLCTLAGQPATAFPVGLSRGGLPLGLQVIGPYLEDRTPLRFAELLAREIGGFQAPPGYVES